jgi:hypothetical protein
MNSPLPLHKYVLIFILAMMWTVSILASYNTGKLVTIQSYNCEEFK